MSDALDLMKRVWKRYGVLIAVTGEVKKATPLKRLEGDKPPGTLKALGRMLSAVVDPDDVTIFVPTSLEGGSHLSKLAESDDYSLVGDFFKDLVAQGKEKGAGSAEKEWQRANVKLAKRLRAAEAEIAANESGDDEGEREEIEAKLTGEVTHWKRRTSELDAEVRRLRSQAHMAGSAGHLNGSDTYQVKYSKAMTLNNELVENNKSLKNELEKLRLFAKRISSDEKERLRLEDLEINKRRSEERIESPCTCLGEVENCQRGCNQGVVIKDGHGNVV